MQMVNERVVEWGNVWYTLTQGIMLIFVFLVLVFGYSRILLWNEIRKKNLKEIDLKEKSKTARGIK